jgi:uncharacterized protein (DUF952 family)
MSLLSKLIIFLSYALCVVACSNRSDSSDAPKYLYKVISVENWQESTSKPTIVLSKEDRKFIHLATEDQLKRIIEKYWSKEPEYIILKLNTAKLPGRIVLEVNPGGENEYYHLYNGFIPREAVEDVLVQVNSQIKD